MFKALHLVCPTLVFLLVVAGSTTSGNAASAGEAAVKHHDRVAGYLSRSSIPDSVALLPAPPVCGSAAYAADEDTYRVTRTLRGTVRWNQATEDGNISFPEAASQFSCALEAAISEKETPHLYHLLQRTKSDAYQSVSTAKNHYHRIRPFVVNKESTCSPEYDSRLVKSGSYPSAHATTGWVWALILAEIDPEHMDAILARGMSYAQSRVICGAHWQSDVTAGQILASGVVARLHADPVFCAELAEAKAELAAVRAKKLKPVRNCREEAAESAYDSPRKTVVAP